MTPPDDNFELKQMTQAELNDIIRKHQMFLAARPGGARAVVRDRNLSRLSFAGQNLSQSDFTGCIMAGADLTNASFESATLFGCDLNGAKLNNTRLVRADLRGCDVDEADLKKADLSGADLREGKTILKRKIRSESDQYSNSSEAGAVQFNGSDLTDAILTGANAVSADFSDSILQNANMQGINLKGAILRGADISGADLKGADLRDSDFSYAIITGANMEGTEQTGTNFTLTLTGDAVGDDIAEMDLTLDELVLKHTQWVATGGRQGVQLTLDTVDLRRGVELASKRLTAIRANKSTFAEMDLRGIEMQGANLDASDFRKCQMNKADLRGSRFRGCLFNRAILKGADFNPLAIRKRDGDGHYNLPCRFDNAWLRHADLSGARMMEAVFKDADLTSANFSDCDLRKADFRGAKLHNAQFENALLDDAQFDVETDPRNS